MGLFDLNGDYYKTAYAFKAMGRMLDAPRRIAVEGHDTFGFAALAGRSADDKTVQVFISNYAIPAGYKPKDMHVPAELRDPAAPSQWDEHKYKLLPNRTDIVYRDNAGYCLTIKNLPWGKAAFTLKRYRISKTQRLELVEEKAESGETLTLSNAFPIDTVELLVLERQ